jgi:hypothetical protein
MEHSSVLEHWSTDHLVYTRAFSFVQEKETDSVVWKSSEHLRSEAMLCKPVPAATGQSRRGQSLQYRLYQWHPLQANAPKFTV